MKKIKILSLVLLLFFGLVGCSSLAVNEIHNRSFNYGEITLGELNALTTTIVTKTRDSIIGITNYEENKLFGFNAIGTGSGVVYDCRAIMNDKGTQDCQEVLDSDDVSTFRYLAVTNRHVIENNAKIKVYVGGDDDIQIDAKVLGYDNKVDLAVVEFDFYRFIRPVLIAESGGTSNLEFADSDTVEAGNLVIAIGNPYGSNFSGTATFGIVSAPKRYISEDTNNDDQDDWDNLYIQHDASINSGNSGGGLFNMEGKLIGINTLKYVSKPDKLSDIDFIEGMGFAIPSNVVLDLLPYLENGKRPNRGLLGVEVISVKHLNNPDDYRIEDRHLYKIPSGLNHGMYISNLSADNPNNQKFLPDDIILEVNNKKVSYIYDVREEIDYIKEGDTLNFLVLRNNKEILITIEYKEVK